MATDFKPYRGIINATVNPPELVKALAKQKFESGAGVREYVSLSRCHNMPGTKRNIPHTLPLEDSYNEDGSTTSTRPKTKTTRKNH